MTTYNAEVVREGRMWVVTVEGVGVTQGRTLAEAGRMADDLVVAMKGEPAEAVAVHVQLPDGLEGRLAEVRQQTAAARTAQQEAAEQARALVHDLQGRAALSGRDIAYLLGVSEQRVSQLRARPVPVGRGAAAGADRSNAALGTALDAWEGERGPFTDVELVAAAQA